MVCFSVKKMAKSSGEEEVEGGRGGGFPRRELYLVLLQSCPVDPEDDIQQLWTHRGCVIVTPWNQEA